MREGVDIIVVNYRTTADFVAFMNSAIVHKDIPQSIVMVNVCPTQQDEDAAWSYLAHADYFQSEENIGYARAVNHAATFGDRETIAIFNADTILTENVVKQCHNMLHYPENPEWAIVGPRLIDEQNRITHGGFFPEGERGFHHLNSEEFNEVREAVTVSGAAYFIKRTVWEELTECPIYHKQYPEAEGAFLPTRHYYEETWCSRHAQAHGYKVIYNGQSTMIHKWHRASPRGGWAEEQIPESKRMFVEMCTAHEIEPHV